MKRFFFILILIISVLTVFSGCNDRDSSDKPTGPVAPVGIVPRDFKDIIENNTFYNIHAFESRLLKTEVCTDNAEAKTLLHTVIMMDLYGNEIARYSISSPRSYEITALTVTDDGGFLFVLGFQDFYNFENSQWESENGFSSRVIKCDKNGNPIFDTPFTDIDGYALEYCLEKNGQYYFFGSYQTPHSKKTGIYSPTDVYMAILNQNGEILNTKCIKGSDFDNLEGVKEYEDGFILYVKSQSDDGAYEGSGSNGYPVKWVFTVNGNLEITEMENNGNNYFSGYRVGEKDGDPVYRTSDFLKGFDAGMITSYIDYGRFYLIVSENVTGTYTNQPPYISFIWHYTETVYSAYDLNGKLIFRASVDSSPDYDSMVEDHTASGQS